MAGSPGGSERSPWLTAPLRTAAEVAKRLNVSVDQVKGYFENCELAGGDFSTDGPSRSSFFCPKCRTRVSVQRKFESRGLKCPVDGNPMKPPSWKRRDLRFRDEEVERFIEERFRQSAIETARGTVQRAN